MSPGLPGSRRVLPRLAARIRSPNGTANATAMLSTRSPHADVDIGVLSTEHRHENRTKIGYLARRKTGDELHAKTVENRRPPLHEL
jgi:hypothetical protein